MTSPSTIPVHVLTGFLGSGKTTLLNRALASEFGAETAVIVNEFGEVALDQLLIQERSEETIVLKSGCVCCSSRTDLVSTLMQLAAMTRDGRPPFGRVIIETSGISDPVPILTTLRCDFNLLARFHIGTTVCTVDATAPDDVRGRPESLSQIAAADACIITKRDLASPQTACGVEDWVRALNPIAMLLPAEGGLRESLERNETQLGKQPVTFAVSASVPPVHSVRSLVLRTANPSSWSRFAVWLSALVFLHGDHILRIKGVLLDQERGAWIAINGVRRFLHPPEHLNLTQPPSDGACLVFITEGLDPALIEQSYRRWVLEDDDSAGASASGRTPAAIPNLSPQIELEGAMS